MFVWQKFTKKCQNNWILISENYNNIHRNGKSNYNITNKNPPVDHENGKKCLLLRKKLKKMIGESMVNNKNGRISKSQCKEVLADKLPCDKFKYV